MGMETMHSRATEAGGICEVTSAPGEGTTVAVRIPYDRSQKLLCLR